MVIKGAPQREFSSKYPIKKEIEIKERNIYLTTKKSVVYDTVQRLNVDARGELLGEFNDKILIIQSGN
jgi:topoisomerase-4 subunit A